MTAGPGDWEHSREDADALLELRSRHSTEGQSLQERWLLEVQRRHQRQPRVQSEANAGRGLGRGRGSARSQLMAPRFADFSRFSLFEADVSRGGVPEVVASRVASEMQHMWAQRAWPGPQQGWPGAPSRRGVSDTATVLAESEARRLVTRAHESGLECSICLQSIHAGHMIMRLPCDVRHAFHETCGKRWLCARSNVCPVCRIAVVVPPHQQRRHGARSKTAG